MSTALSETLSSTADWFETSRPRLLLAWLLVNLVVGLPVSIVATVWYAATHDPAECYDWSLLGFCAATSLLFPVWLVLSAPLPWGWLIYIGLFSVLISRRLTPLILAALGAAAAAAFWPTVYVASMGV